MYVVLGLGLSWLTLVLTPLLVFFLGSHGAGVGVLSGVIAVSFIRSDAQGIVTLWQRLPILFWPENLNRQVAIEKLVRWSQTYRKEGALALDSEADTETDHFIKAGLQALIDGDSLSDTKRHLDVLRHTERRRDYEFAKLLSFMSVSARWVGLTLALVLLISLLHRESVLLFGIDAWLPMFAALGYGLGLSVLFLQPMAERVIAKADQRSEFQLMVTDGMLGILNNENPRVMAHRLHSYCE